MSFTLKLFMFNWVGKFKRAHLSLFFILLVLNGLIARASDQEFQFENTEWSEYTKEVELQKLYDKRNGISYIISGSLALLGGIWGGSVTTDTAEKGIYMAFQTIGVASVGYGAYLWNVGGEERNLYSTLQKLKYTDEQKSQFLKTYRAQAKERVRKERLVKAITHGLLAGINLYNASQQKQDSLKGALYFVGTVNLLAAVSYTFEF